MMASPFLHRLGMPELCALGLSEHWLLKACGERHWQALAAAAGQEPHALRDAQGRRLYAAFTEVTLRHGALHRATEGDLLALHSQLVPLDRAQAASTHRATVGERLVAEVSMRSVFVAHAVSQPGGHDNHRIVRSDVVAPALRPANHLPRHRPARANPTPASDVLAVHDCRPCPTTDFNGAGLLYFASFQALIDRALWAWGLPCDRLGTRERRLRFYGNLNIGARLRIELLAQRAVSADPSDGTALEGFETRVQVRRLADDKVIAEADTLLAEPCAAPAARQACGEVTAA